MKISIVIKLCWIFIWTDLTVCQRCPKSNFGRWKFGVSTRNGGKGQSLASDAGKSPAAVVDGLSRKLYVIDSIMAEGADIEVNYTFSKADPRDSDQIRASRSSHKGWQRLCEEVFKFRVIRFIVYKNGLCNVLYPWNSYRFPYKVCSGTNRRCDGIADKSYWCMPDAYRFFKIWIWCSHTTPKYNLYWFQLPQACCCKRWKWKCNKMPKPMKAVKKKSAV